MECACFFGESFDKDLRDGCKPAWSLRALGTLVQTNRGAEVKKLKLITWDQVIYPSHPHAYTQKVLTESAAYENDSDVYAAQARIIPITNQSVIDYIKSESANLKFLEENFDFMFNTVKYNKDASQVILTCESGDTLVVNLERYLNDEIRNYASRISEIEKY